MNSFSLYASSSDNDVNTSTTKIDSSIKLGIKTDFSYYNDGLREDSTQKNSPTGSFTLSALEVEFFNQLNIKNVKYHLNLDLLSEMPVKLGFASYDLSKSTQVSLGKIRVNQGGFHVKNHSFDTRAVGIYEKEHMPFDENAVLLACSTDIAGKVTLQLLNDPIKGSPFPDAPYWNSSEKQPTVTVEWIGEFGPFLPLIQLGSYDFSHSKYFVLGTQTTMSSLRASFDFIQDLRSHKVADSTGYKNLQGILQSWSFSGSYEFKHKLRPEFFVSSFEYREPKDEKINENLIDYEGNNTEIVGEETSFNDNGYTWMVSVDYLGMKEEVQPYMAIIGRSAKWINPSRGIETRRDLKLNMGIIGRI